MNQYEKDVQFLIDETMLYVDLSREEVEKEIRSMNAPEISYVAKIVRETNEIIKEC